MSALDTLARGIDALGLALPAGTPERLLAYAQLLTKWNKVYNLTAIRNESEVITHHLLDSLSVLPHLADVRRLVDVGSGGGLPGIVLAIARPDLEIDSVETVQKKATFQNQARIELRLANFRAHHARIESWTPPQPADGVISRAFSDLADFTRLSQHVLAPAGRLYAMKGVLPADEIAQLPDGFSVERTIPLDVPGLAAARHLILISRT